MLRKALRLSRAQFTTLISTPDLKVIFNRLGTLKYTKEVPALSVVTSSKHEKRAVERNKIRRRIYSNFDAGTGIRGVLYVSKHSYRMNYDEIKILFHELLQKTSK